MMEIERTFRAQSLSPSVNEQCWHSNLQMGLWHSSLYSSLESEALSGEEMMTELIFAQGFTES